MRWFKHLVEASDDDFIKCLEHKYGWEGYGRWWKLCETIGKTLKKKDPTATRTMPWSDWQKELKGKRENLRSFLGFLEEHGRITLKENGEILTIDLPKLLKYRDEYQKRSGHTPDTNREFVGTQDVQSTEAQRTENRNTDSEKEQRVIQSIESFTVTEELRMWAQLNTPHVDIPVLTAKWKKAVRDHHYRNANGLIENAAASWKTAMTDAEKREAKRDTTPQPQNRPIGLAERYGMRYYDDVKRERELRQVQPTVTAGSVGPMLSVRSNG